MLLFEMTRFAAVMRPRAVMIEQVKGLLNAPDEDGLIGGVFKRLLSEFRSAWLYAKVEAHHRNAIRSTSGSTTVFVICMLDADHFVFPEPTHIAPGANLSLFSLPPYRTVGDVLAGLPLPPLKDAYTGDDSHVDFTPAGDRRRIHGVLEGSHLAAQVHLPIEQRCNLMKKDTTKFRRMSRSEPAITLRCGEIFFHPTEDRYLTIREYMRIHTYPDDYLLQGPMRGRSGRVRNNDQYRQVANSVPPLIARILAEAIQETLTCHPSLNSMAIP